MRRQSTDCGGGEEEEDGNDRDNNNKDVVEDAKDAVPPCRPQGPGGRVKSLGSPIHPCVILPPPPEGGSVIVIKGRQGGGGDDIVSISHPLGPHACLP